MNVCIIQIDPKAVLASHSREFYSLSRIPDRAIHVNVLYYKRERKERDGNTKRIQNEGGEK
jgi:hypothetical protein